MHARFDEFSITVRDDTEHVMHVGVGVEFGDHLAKELTRLFVLPLIEMLAAEQELLLQVFIHGTEVS